MSKQSIEISGHRAAMHAALNETLEEITQREKTMEVLYQSAITFLSRNEESFEDVMTTGMGMIVEMAKLDRLALWRNFSTPEGLHATQVYRWDREAGGTTRPAAGLEDLSYARFAPGWDKILGSGESINSPVNLLPDAADALKSYGVVSVFVAPVFISNEFWGFVLFEDRRNERFFDDVSADMMRSAALLCVTAFLRTDMERILDETNKRIRLMLDSNPMICILRDETGRIIDCNQAALDIFGVADKNTFYRVYFQFYPEYQPDGARSLEKSNEILSELTEKGKIGSFEWMFRTAKGEALPVETTMIKIKWGDVYRILSYSRDLREVKAGEQKMMESAEREREAELKREAAQAANEAKSQFLANVSHEIRTPMNAILGMSELLMQEDLNNRQRRYADDIKTSAEALLGIINDILDVSKIQAGKLSLLPVHYDFNLMLDNIGSMAQFLVEGKNIAFRFVMREQEPLYLYGDDVRLRQVLLNLISNAIKFTKEGYVELTVSMTDATISITVSDTGVGIPPENLPTLFDPFEQADMINNRAMQGTGLGLTITRAIVEMMGGSIAVESRYGEGSSFHVKIPRIPGNPNLIRQSETVTIPLYAPEAKVLVVDDNRSNLNVACGLLQLVQITADTAESGMEAIRMIQKNQYDLVFMDHRMPEMSGTEATKIIRDMGISVPIVALTASAVVGAKEMMLAAGMNDYLLKPVVKSELMQVLKNWIPLEKQKIPEAWLSLSNTQVEEDRREFWERIGRIEWLSLPTGLSIVEGQRDVFEKTLRLMTAEIEKTCQNSGRFLAEDDLENFRIEVHGIKSSLANIGALELSSIALELEMAADRGDKLFCKVRLPLWQEDLIDLNRQISEAFDLISKNQGPIDMLPELPGIFDRMFSAFEEGNLVMIDSEIENLEALKAEGALKDEIERIKDAVMMMDYDGAGMIMHKLLAESR